jgi:NSS family neurotransmitter:Na+ symporter
VHYVSLAAVKLFGLTFFDLYDFISSNILLPLGGLLITIFMAWVRGWLKFKEAVTNEGTIANAGGSKPVFTILKYISPVLVAVILLPGLNLIHTKSMYFYREWIKSGCLVFSKVNLLMFGLI